MEDIKVDDDWQLTRAANGDAPTTSGSEEFLQSIRLESMTQEGDLFYDPDYGWSLLDFVHSTESSLLRTAVEERVRSKMAARSEVDASSLQVDISFREDMLELEIQFGRKDDEARYKMKITLDRIRMEVTADD